MKISRIWQKVKVPLYILLLWVVISFIWRTDNPSVLVWKHFIGAVISISVFAFIGFLATKEKNPMKKSLEYGGFVSIVGGLSFALTFIMENILVGERMNFAAELMETSWGIDPSSAIATVYLIVVALGLLVFLIVALVGICISAITTFFYKRYH